MTKCCGRWLAGACLAGAAWFTLPATVSAQLAFTTQAVNVRAGPDRGFPLVAWLPAGTSVNIVGCIDGWRWCDVVTQWDRGWVYARFLSITFQNQPVTIIYNGPRLGLPLITFSVGPYWGSHYRGRPWYGRQHHWSNWSPPPPVVRPPHRPPGWRPPPHRPPHVRPPSPRPPIAGPRPPGQGPGMGPGRPPGQGPGTGPPPRPRPPPGQGPGMGPGAPPGNITRPPRGG